VNFSRLEDQIIKTIGLKRGQSIADIGAGGGYFSLRFSERVFQEFKTIFKS